MTQLILWMIMTYGLSNILVYGSIFSGPRDLINKLAATEGLLTRGFWVFLSDMLKCMMCAPTWVGFILGMFLYSPVGEILNIPIYVSWFFDGMLASGSTWAINSVVEWFEENRPSKG